MKNANQRGIIDPIIILALIVLLGVGGFALWRINSGQNDTATNNTDHTKDGSSLTEEAIVKSEPSQQTSNHAESNLKTYKNSAYKLSLKYPNSDKWKIFTGEEAEDSATGFLIKYDCGRDCGLAFSMSPNEDSQNDAIQRIKSQFEDNSTYTLQQQEPITLGSVDGTKLTFSPGGVENINDIVHVVTDKVIIDINPNGSTSSSLDVTNEGLKILDSLKFD